MKSMFYPHVPETKLTRTENETLWPVSAADGDFAVTRTENEAVD